MRDRLRLLAAITAIGVAVAALVQRFTPTGWWLNSANGVSTTLAVFFVVSAAVALIVPFFSTPSATPRDVLRLTAGRIAALWCGIMAGQTLVLFTLGPGSLFPIVLTIAAVMSGLAVGAGAVSGTAVQILYTRVIR